MGWEGATGHLYTRGLIHTAPFACKRYDPVQGRKIKAIYGNYSSSLALVDAWEFEWTSTQDQVHVISHVTLYNE